MNAIALALPTPLSAAATPAPVAPALAVPAAPAAGLHLLAATCVAQTADLLRLACRRGQLEDASAAARVAMPLAQPHSPHAAMLQALADAQPLLMLPPEERRLYMVRRADGSALGVVRLRDNGRVAQATVAGAAQWALHDGNLELRDAAGQVSRRFMLCGERAGLRLYLGECLGGPGAGEACLLQELRCTYTRLSLLDPELVDPFVSLYSAADMVPAALPERATLLLGAPHTRCSQLRQALNRSAGVLFDGELLHPQGMQLDEQLLSHSAGRSLHALRAKDAPWFARMMLGRSHDAQGRDLGAMQVRGFSMAPSHSQAALDWALAEPTLRIVHVVRSNLLAEFADILAKQQADAQALLHFEPERFGRFIEMTRRHLDGLRQRLRQRNADTVEVDGSRLNQATLAELLAFLTDAADSSQIDCEAVPISAQRVVERFDNPEAVLPCLRALGRPGWAEAEGQVLDAD
ncbi:MAG: hypothetical protein V4795_19155 [Pseudomonadota bacterium]